MNIAEFTAKKKVGENLRKIDEHFCMLKNVRLLQWQFSFYTSYFFFICVHCSVHSENWIWYFRITHIRLCVCIPLSISTTIPWACDWFRLFFFLFFFWFILFTLGKLTLGVQWILDIVSIWIIFNYIYLQQNKYGK